MAPTTPMKPSKKPAKHPQKGWLWSATKDRAAVMLARGDSINEAARVLRVNEKTIDDWKRAPEFAARLEEQIAKFRERFLRNGLAAKERRLAKLTDLYQRLESEIEARG